MSDHEPDLQCLLDWLAIDSTTGRERAFLERLEEDLGRRGLRCTRQAVSPGRWNLVAAPPANTKLLFSTHVDTVPPHFGPRRDGAATRARGACDTKGGLFAMLRAWHRLPEDLRRVTGFLLVVGEEVNHDGAIRAAELSFPDLRAILLCEPTRGRVALGQKGIVRLRLRATGVAGHSAFPEAGRSAVPPLLDALDALRRHPWPGDDTLGDTDVNIGVLTAGPAANIFAPEASAELLFRIVTPADEVLNTIRSLIPDGVVLDIVSTNDPMQLLPVPGEDTCIIPFNTDAPYLRHLAPVVLAGPGDIRSAHSPDEILTDRDLENGVEQYARIASWLLTRAERPAPQSRSGNSTAAGGREFS